MKKILYMSVHETLEFDELKLFTELGYECYSLGAYTQPGGEEHRKRPALSLPYNPHFIELALQIDRRKLIPEILKGIDIVVVMHEPSFVVDNWELFQSFIQKGGRVIWRSIGQSIPHVERRLKPCRDEGLEVVRYSPAEATIADNIGSDAMIRFYKDPLVYKDWNGSRKQVINFTQSLKQRADFTGYRLMKRVFDDFPAKVYGPNNDDLGLLNGGLLSYQEQLNAFREARVFFYHGTYPASYTLSFIEAWITGTPIVAVGKKRGNSYEMFPDQDTYEVADLIEHGVNGFVSDNVFELRDAVHALLNDIKLAQSISAFGRNKAIELFGKDAIMKQWREFLSK